MAAVSLLCVVESSAQCSSGGVEQAVQLDASVRGAFVLSKVGTSAPLYLDSPGSETLRAVAHAFAGDVVAVTGAPTQVLEKLPERPPSDVVIIGTIGASPVIDNLISKGKLDAGSVRGKWESAVVQVVSHPRPGVRRALVVAGSDRRGVAFALFTISRSMGVSPWAWWSDVPIAHHSQIQIRPGCFLQGEPSVQYRGIFLNDEEFGLIPWAAAKMDPNLHSIGPRTYEKVFEFLLRLRANSLWPAMHKGSLPFNALPENAMLADKWAIVMGSSHSEALLRNNVGEWDVAKDGPWNYQINHDRMDRYWEDRLKTNGRHENFYTVGLRGRHDSPIEAEGTPEIKAHLVEAATEKQRQLLAKYVNSDVHKVPQVMWLYKEALDLYRVGMHVPDDVTLGWVDDNYGYIRELPDDQERARSGGSGMYYHVSYRGDPNDYLWLCTTPPDLIREEMSKAFDHGVRKYWVVNVGDLKPAEIDTDYFFQLAWDEPRFASVSQSSFLRSWMAEQFSPLAAGQLTEIMNEYYHLNFIRRPESMGFNGKNGPVNRTDFNPLAWGDQNAERVSAWTSLSDRVEKMTGAVPVKFHDAWFELVQYPVQAAAALNVKVLQTDRTYLDAFKGDEVALHQDSQDAMNSYQRVKQLTSDYNRLDNGKWEAMMSWTPNNKAVFQKPALATIADRKLSLSPSWAAFSGVAQKLPEHRGFVEYERTVSICATHFARKGEGLKSSWQVLPQLGISCGSVYYGIPGSPAVELHGDSTPKLRAAPWLEYDLENASNGIANLAIHVLPTFPVDTTQKLRFAVSVDGAPAQLIDAGHSGKWRAATDPAAKTWMGNVVRNSAVINIPLGDVHPGKHTIRIMYVDPGVVFEHLVLTFNGSPPAYPVPPETTRKVINSTQQFTDKELFLEASWDSQRMTIRRAHAPVICSPAR